MPLQVIVHLIIVMAIIASQPKMQPNAKMKLEHLTPHVKLGNLVMIPVRINP
jgi:hypothetical protein